MPNDEMVVGDVGTKDELDIMNEGNEDETKEEEKEEDTKEEGESDGDDETDDETSEDETEEEETEEDDEEEDKEGDDEEEDGSTERLSTYTDIKKTYPDFFKKFPDVRSALFRDEKYAEMFGSIKEAEQASRDAQVFMKMSDDLLEEGNIVPLMDQIGKQKPEALEKIAYSILPYLAEKNKDLYFEVASVPVKSLIRNVIRSLEGKTDKDSINLRNSAFHLHKYVFNDYEIDAQLKGEKAAKPVEKSSREAELEKKLSQREIQDQDNFMAEVDGRYVRSVNKLIESALGSDTRLTDWMKAKISTDVIKEVKKQMDGDKRFVSTMRNLISQAKRSNYSSDFKSRVYTAALERAKPLIPTIRKKLVAEALGKKVSSKSDSSNGSDSKKKFTPRKAEAANTNGSKAKKPSSSPDMDIIRG